ncbi:GspH/FimT family pseudopilin [Pseudomonas sp. EGD-AK9]|uniref:GspH/FimT family pseudopilin n=1 Tax=Pseudomonas sp. EGD-AK9 TaxID=1386078 RepID=UPI0004CE3BE9|nr:GspH/FimT family pseudopilin [Pseudomonas sp. EGD-AK9]
MRTATCAAGSKALRGFTLLELLVVLVIASLAVGLVGPAVQRMLPGAELKTHSRELLAQVRYARSQAILSQQPVHLRHDEQSHSLSFSHHDKPMLLPASVQLVLEPGSHGGPDDPEDAIIFYPQGYSSGGLIRLGASGGRQFEIAVDWLTGRVQLQ